MATYAEMKTRIITEMSRDDLEDDLATQLTTHIARACEYYADRKFWFNSVVTTAATVASTETVAIPATVRRIDRLTIPASTVELIEATLAELDNIESTAGGRPTHYAYYNDFIRLYPVPDAVYALKIYGLSQIAAPSEDADENAWTDEAYDLIVAHTKMTLYRGQFRDPEGTQLALAEVKDALDRLQRETAKRLVTTLRGPREAPWAKYATR
jgi:hypothetical protein